MSDIGACPICSNLAEYHLTNFDGNSLTCLRCGKYTISGTLEAIIKNGLELDKKEITVLSGYIRENPGIMIDSRNYKSIISNHRIPNLDEKIEITMILLEEINSKPGAIIDVSDDTENYFKLLGTAYIEDQEEWEYIFRDYLDKKLNFVEFVRHAYNLGDKKKFDFKITPEGWKYIDSKKTINQDSNTAFIAMWFDSKVEETRRVIKQAIRNAGYIPKIVDEERHNDDITAKIITLIKRARFLVADFTEQRAGVYYEAGFARGLNIPVIHTAQQNEIKNLHFDINHQSFIAWEEEKLDELKNELTLHITSTIGDGPYISSIIPEEENLILEELLRSEDKILIKVEDNSGLTIQINNKNLIPNQSPKTVAIWREAFQQLLDKGLIRDQGAGTVFDLTIKGFDTLEKI